MATVSIEEHKDLTSLPDFGKTKHKGRYSLPQMLSGTPSTWDVESEGGVWGMGVCESGGYCLPSKPASGSTGRKEARNLYLFFKIKNKNLMKCHQDCELKKQSQVTNPVTMAPRLFPSGRLHTTTLKCQGLSPVLPTGNRRVRLCDQPFPSWWLGIHLALCHTFCFIFLVFKWLRAPWS